MPRVLIVEDESTLRDIESMALREFGYSVHSVSSAEDAKQWLEENTADLLVLDIMLPGQGGVEFMLEMRSRQRTEPLRAAPKILFTSGYVDTSHALFRSLAEKFGVFSSLQKPFTVDEFIARVAEILPVEVPTDIA